MGVNSGSRRVRRQFRRWRRDGSVVHPAYRIVSVAALTAVTVVVVAYVLLTH